MTDETITGWRTRLLRIWAWSVGWCSRHQVAAAVIAGLLAGLTAPPLVRWWFGH